MKLNPFGGLVCFFLVTISNVFAEDQIFVSGWDSPNPLLYATNTTGIATLSDSGITGAWSVSATYGRVTARAVSFFPGYPYVSGSASASGQWTDTITIQPDDPALAGMGGTATFIYHLSGSATTTDYQRCQFNVSTECDCGGPSTYTGSSLNSTFTIVRGFTFGVPFDVTMSMSAVAKGSIQGDNIGVTMTSGGMTVTDSGNAPASYTSTSNQGVQHAATITNGVSYAGFSVTNNLGKQTALQLLDGTNSISGTNEMVATTFLASPDTNQIVSDVVDFSGTDTNLFVLQMTFDQLAAVAHLGSETNALLRWFNQNLGKWVNAVEGNSDDGLAQHFFIAPYDSSKFQLGNFGVDTNAHVTWAVLDHNSQFAVGGTATALQFSGVTIKTNGVSLAASGPASDSYFVEQSSDLSATNWTALGLLQMSNGVGIFNDSNSVSATPQRFYRARQ